MPAQPVHAKLITAAAREVLAPLGLVRKGRRWWAEDRGWWVLTVAFGSSSFSPGTYVTVAWTPLWIGGEDAYERAVFGGRLRWDPKRPRRPEWWPEHFPAEAQLEFLEFHGEEEFADEIEVAVEAAAARVAEVRAEFGTLLGWKVHFDGDWSATVEQVRALGYKPSSASCYHAGVVAGLFGEGGRARELLEFAAGRQERHVASLAGGDEERRRRTERALTLRVEAARRLAAVADDEAAFREVVLELIAESRAATKLDPERPLELP